jgi:hypothetical protein
MQKREDSPLEAPQLIDVLNIPSSAQAFREATKTFATSAIQNYNGKLLRAAINLVHALTVFVNVLEDGTNDERRE